MNHRTDGSTRSPPRAMAKGMGQIAQDIVSLAELQIELGKIDAREATRRLVTPVILMVAAVAVALGTIPVALLFVAEALAQIAGLSLWLGLLIATLLGALIAGAVAAVAWRRLRQPIRLFGRSLDELKRNVEWIKRVVTRRETRPF